LTVSNEICFSGIHRLSHHAEPGDLFPVIGESVEEKPIVVERKKRRAFRTK